MQAQYEDAVAGSSSPPGQIGLALGGDEKSLRTEPSNPSVRDREQAAAEEYELHEVSSAGGSSAGGSNLAGSGSSNSFRNRMARGAPVLQHPGNGRYSPDRILPPPAPAHTMHNGLGEGDDVQGRNAI